MTLVGGNAAGFPGFRRIESDFLLLDLALSRVLEGPLLTGIPRERGSRGWFGCFSFRISKWISYMSPYLTIARAYPVALALLGDKKILHWTLLGKQPRTSICPEFWGRRGPGGPARCALRG